jgi:hypothetical protein
MKKSNWRAAAVSIAVTVLVVVVVVVWEGVVGTGWSGLRIGTGGGHL